MRASQTREEWESYRASELAVVEPYLQDLGFELDAEQPHVGGERHLMSGRKLVLNGTRAADGARVVIKVSSDAESIAEIEHEHRARKVLEALPFAERPFLAPTELVHEKRGAHLISGTGFIEQPVAFIAHSPEEQFFLALRALAVQEGIHATTFEHARTIRDAFGVAAADTYLSEFLAFSKVVAANEPENQNLIDLFSGATEFLTKHRTTIERFCGFLTHTDFAPHNLRIDGRSVILIDLPALRFGNKYESWARFLNYMVVHNPQLERMLSNYIQNNRSEEEYLSLRLMRVFKLGELLRYYVVSLDKTEGNLRALNMKRINFWTDVLRAVLKDEQISPELVEAYIGERDSLRSSDERKRQEAIQQVV